jgi:hypothetical protein
MRILTLYICKDYSHFKWHNFANVLFQRNIQQDIFIVSAEPILIKGIQKVHNIVIPVRLEWPLPIRVAYSINAAIRLLRSKFGVKLQDYHYIFKVDSDVMLPFDYLENLILKHSPVAGIGAALLISVPFFLIKLKGRYPINYCDDGYVGALSLSMGVWPPSYNGFGKIYIVHTPVHNNYLHEREYAYGIEYYKWGLPLVILIMRVCEKGFRSILTNITGYLRATLYREDKYHFHRSYSKIRTRYFAENIIKRLSSKNHSFRERWIF